MAGAQDHKLAIAVARAGGLGSLPCAMLSPQQLRDQMRQIRAKTKKPVNLNFFCHAPPAVDPAREAIWKKKLEPYYREFGLDPEGDYPAPNRAPFDDAMCAAVEDLKPEVVSFHFGLPEARLLGRVRLAGAKIISSATTVREARFLSEQGCDAIIAQGLEAGGHRGMFLETDVAMQPGTFALVEQIAASVRVPVIAAGGIMDGRGVAAVMNLGASAAQPGTAYLLTPESTISPVYRKALTEAKDDNTAITNVFSGRPARGIINRLMRELGPLSPDAPAFPRAAIAVAPLRAQAEAKGLGDFSTLWAGQAARLGRPLPAGELTRLLAAEALEHLRRVGGADGR